MCLDSITKTGLVKSGYGWKLFNERNGSLYSLIYDDKSLPRNRWLKAKRRVVEISDYAEYTAGFHIFTNKKATRDWTGVIYKVKYRKGHTLGKQYGDNVMVADEMLILPLQRKGA